MTVVLLHGFCETKAIWNHFLPEIEGELDCIALDLKGFGQNQSLQEDLSLSGLAKQVRKELTRLEIVHPVLVGHSLGGYVALEYAREFSHDLEGIVLFHSTAFPDTPEKQKNRDKTVAFVQAYGLESFSDYFTPSLFHNPDHPEIEALRRITATTPIQTFIKVTNAMRNRPDYTKLLRTQELPVHYILGREDRFVPIEREIQLIETLPHVTYEVISDCGHLGMIEKPEVCACSLTHFLKKNRYFLFE